MEPGKDEAVELKGALLPVALLGTGLAAAYALLRESLGSGWPPDVQNLLLKLGLAFQIVDDLLDVQGNMEDTGKRVGKDSAAGILTYPAVLGVEESAREAEQLLADAQAAVSELGDLGEPLRLLARTMKKRNK